MFAKQDRRPQQVGWLVSLLLHGALALMIAFGSGVQKKTRQSYMRIDVRRPTLKKTPPPPPEMAAKKIRAEPIRKKVPPKVFDLTVKPAAKAANSGRAAPKPIFGVHKKAVSLGGSFKVRVGNSLRVKPADRIVDPDKVPDEVPVALDVITQMPRVKEAVLPDYPEALRLEGVEAVVLVEIVISSTGHVTQARVVESADKRFNASALLAAKETKFEPARSAQGAVAVKIRLPVAFRLSQ